MVPNKKLKVKDYYDPKGKSISYKKVMLFYSDLMYRKKMMEKHKINKQKKSFQKISIVFKIKETIYLMPILAELLARGSIK